MRPCIGTPVQTFSLDSLESRCNTWPGGAESGDPIDVTRSRASRSYLIVGLTGGIASGKSTVSRQLGELGCEIIDADLLAREVVAPGEPAWRQIAEAFGREVLQADGALDRKRLAALVFADPEERRRLEAIIHPAVHSRRQVTLADLTARGFDGIVIQDAALLIEVGGAKEVDRLVVVYAERAIQLERLRHRDGLDPAEAERRVASQMPLLDKVRLADYVIDNSGSPEETAAQVRAVHAALRAERGARGVFEDGDAQPRDHGQRPNVRRLSSSTSTTTT